jgi:hypothetical protein
MIKDITEDTLDKLPKPMRKKLCWLLGHKYKVIWFKSKTCYHEQSGIADTENGCIFCGHAENNKYPIAINEIDYKATRHRSEPPKYNVFLTETESQN